MLKYADRSLVMLIFAKKQDSYAKALSNHEKCLCEWHITNMKIITWINNVATRGIVFNSQATYLICSLHLLTLQD